MVKMNQEINYSWVAITYFPEDLDDILECALNMYENERKKSNN